MSSNAATEQNATEEGRRRPDWRGRPSGAEPGPAPRDRSSAVVLVLCAAAFMAMLDVFVVNVAFTDIGASFPGSALSSLSWVLNAYAIGYAALLIPAGRLADRYGRKVSFLAGLTVFTLASAACAAAPSLWWLVALRVVQAAGAAALTPASLGLLLTVLPPDRRAGAVRVWATTSSVAAAVGPVVGGALVELSWRWVFLINLPIGVVVFWVARRLIPRSPADASAQGDAVRMPDLLGVAVLAATIGAAALGLVKGGEWGWSSPTTLAVFAAALIGAGCFMWRTLRHPSPVVDPALFRAPAFRWANLTVLTFCTAFGAAFPAVVLWLEQVAGFSAIRTGLAILPGPTMVPIFAVVGRRLAARVPAGRLVAAGNLVFGVGAIMLALGVSGHAAYATHVLPGWIVTGVGIGLALPTMLTSATAALPAEQAATGSAVVNTSRQLGYVLGVAILVAVLGAITGTPEQVQTGFRHAWLFIAVTAVLSAATALGSTPRKARS